MAITKTEQHALWEQVSIRMTAIDEVGRAFDRENWRDAERLGREFCALLQLCDDLGWGRGSEGEVTLRLPANALRLAFARIREMALYLRSRNDDEAQDASEEMREARSLEETCERVLGELGAEKSVA